MAEIPNIGFDRAKSPLQNVLCHQILEYSHFKCFQHKYKHPHIYHPFDYYAKTAFIRAVKNNRAYMGKCATLWGTKIYNRI